MVNAMETEFLSKRASLVIVSTASFVCRWMYAFERLANTISFATQGVDSVVPTTAIACNTPCRYAVADQFEAVQIPYQAEGLSLVVLLPPALEFFKTRQHIETTALLSEIMGKLDKSEQKRKVVLPSFQVVIGEPTSSTLASLGIDNIFYNADNQSGGITGWKDMFVSNVTQTVLFQVDIDEPASPTAPCKSVRGKEKAGLDKLFIANRPFYYMVWNGRTQIPLLFGQMCSPRNRV
jgi:serine protease inhibitor